MLSARRGRDFGGDRYGPLATVAHTPSNLHVVIYTASFLYESALARDIRQPRPSVRADFPSVDLLTAVPCTQRPAQLDFDRRRRRKDPVKQLLIRRAITLPRSCSEPVCIFSSGVPLPFLTARALRLQICRCCVICHCNRSRPYFPNW
jgi:hypothetical protein